MSCRPILSLQARGSLFSASRALLAGVLVVAGVGLAGAEPVTGEGPPEVFRVNGTPDDARLVTGESGRREAALSAPAAGRSRSVVPDPGGPAPDFDALPPVATRPAVMPTHHRVEAGETLIAIGDRYGLDPRDLARRNAIDSPRALMPGQVLVLPATSDRQPGTLAEAPETALRVEAVLEEVAREFGWRRATIKAIAWVESGWTQEVVSPQGAVGVMQVRPSTGEKMSERLGEELDLYDLRDNVTAGVAYLDLLYERYDGDLRATLAAYHQGPTSLGQEGVLAVSESYISEALALRERFGD